MRESSNEHLHANRCRMLRLERPFFWLPIVLLLFLVAACSDRGIAPGERVADVGWPTYGSDPGSRKFSPVDQIDASDFDELEVLWRWRSPDGEILAQNPDLWTNHHEATPILVDGVLYTSTGLSQVAAIDPSTGDTLWVYNPRSWEPGSPPNHGFVHRGVAHWSDDGGGRIFIATGDAYLIALDAATGQPIPTFGDDGRVALTEGMRRSIDTFAYGVSSPPTICGGVVVVGSSVLDNVPAAGLMAPGDVRGFDPRTGELEWIFQSIPQPGEFGHETWLGDSWRDVGGANVWPPMSCDEELGLVYLPFGTPTNDHYGGMRPGAGLFGESLVALHARTGELAWYYQFVHHGLWDYDLPAAPTLLDIEVDGRSIAAVAQVTKQAFLFVFDRRTGQPVWPIEERPVAPSTAFGEWTAPTQPFPTKPPPFDVQGTTDDVLIDLTPELRADALERVREFDRGPLYTPPTEKGLLTLPGNGGGASWAGATVHPDRGVLYVPSVTAPLLIKLDESPFGTIGRPEGGRGANFPQSRPLTRPPYGRVTAIDMHRGEILWTSAVGRGPVDQPNFAALGLERVGWTRRSFVLATPNTLFVAQQGITLPLPFGGRSNSLRFSIQHDEPTLWAYDLDDGSIVGAASLPGNATGSPMTYRVDGRQFIVIPIGGGGLPAELVAMGLPDERA